jgi:hypothetical protein
MNKWIWRFQEMKIINRERKSVSCRKQRKSNRFLGLVFFHFSPFLWNSWHACHCFQCTESDHSFNHNSILLSIHLTIHSSFNQFIYSFIHSYPISLSSISPSFRSIIHSSFTSFINQSIYSFTWVSQKVKGFLKKRINCKYTETNLKLPFNVISLEFEAPVPVFHKFFLIPWEEKKFLVGL